MAIDGDQQRADEERADVVDALPREPAIEARTVVQSTSVTKVHVSLASEQTIAGADQDRDGGGGGEDAT